MYGTFLSFLSFFWAALLLVPWWTPPLLGSTPGLEQKPDCWPVQRGYQVISIHTLNGFGIEKYLFTYNTLLSIINGYFLGQVFLAIREAQQQKLQVFHQHCCQPRTVSVFLSYFASNCVHLELSQLILF